MILIALPAFLTPLASLLVALFGALAMSRSHRAEPPLHDSEREYLALERRVRMKANHPYTHWMR